MIWLPRLGVEIRTSPKVLSTSLKLLAYRLETGEDFTPFVRDGKTVYVHAVYPTQPIGSVESPLARYRMAFVRDPVARFASFYRNRVLRRHPAENRQWALLEESDLPMNPSPATLIARLDDYRSVMGSIKHHTEAQVVFLGNDLSYYDLVFNTGQVSQFEDIMTQLTGVPVRLPHEQRSGAEPVEIGPHDVARLKAHFAEDYRVYGDRF